jgi:transcriptional regulator with XRE-family HTH domain
MQEAVRVSKVAAGRIREIRERRRWSQEDLAKRLGELGAPVDRATVARTEGGTRGLSLDDALLYAAALGVAPVYLFTPVDSTPELVVAPELVINPIIARQWMRGLAALREEDNRTYFSEIPTEEWVAQQKRGVHHLLGLVQAFVEAAADDDRARMVHLIEGMNDELERQRTDLGPAEGR